MPGTTPRGYPFPLATEPADGAPQIESLARAVDTDMGARVLDAARKFHAVSRPSDGTLAINTWGDTVFGGATIADAPPGLYQVTWGSGFSIGAVVYSAIDHQLIWNADAPINLGRIATQDQYQRHFSGTRFRAHDTAGTLSVKVQIRNSGSSTTLLAAGSWIALSRISA